MSRDGDLPIFILSLPLALLLQVIALPDAIASLRPLFVPLILAYWTIYSPDMPVMLLSWVLGICCDVVYGTPLGQYALALVTVTYAARSLSNTVLSVPQWQAMLTMVPVWGIYVFLMYWIDGLTHHSADALRRWLPLLGTSLLWPLLAGLLAGIRSRRGDRGLLP